MPERILVLNPGSTGTKIAIFEDESSIYEENLLHAPEELRLFPRVMDQLDFRLESVGRGLTSCAVASRSFSAVAARGGLLRPVEAGTYRVNARMLEDLALATRGEHASNLGAPLARRIADRWGIEAYVVDPVSVDEFAPVARITGLPELERKSLLHALNVRATAREAAKHLGMRFEEVNLVIAHLGSGTSVCPVRKGRIVDVNNANEEGPFSTERTGSLPVGDLVRLCFSGKYTEKDLVRNITLEGGIHAYLGTKDVREVLGMIARGDEKAKLVFDAMIYQTAKEIGSMATVLCGEVDAVVISGGLAYSTAVTSALKERIGYIAPVLVFPGEKEMEALAHGVLRVLRGEDQAKEY